MTDPHATPAADPAAPMTEAERAAKAAEMLPWYWWGVPSFFKCPVDPDPSACDIALVGVPHSAGNGSTERDQHLGPRAVRNVTYRRSHRPYRLNPWEACRIQDLGDVPLPRALDNAACMIDIEGYFRRVDQAGTRVVSIGGDHSITGPILKALGGPGTRLSGGRPLALVHFDAHRDDYEHFAHWMGVERSAAHWSAYTVREGHVDPGRSIQLGMRGHPADVASVPDGPCSAIGHRVVPIEEIRALGPAGTIAEMRARVGDSPIYLTFDLDVLDPIDAPAVSNLEVACDGLRAFQAIELIRGLRGADVVGADIVCMMPTKDAPNHITAMTATVIMFELVCLIADRLRGGAGGA